MSLPNRFTTMQLIRGIDQLNADHQPSVVSIGNYDGVHRGHQHVIKTLLEKSKELNAPATVITFEPLAKEFFQPNSVMRLTSVQERAELLFELGVERVLSIDFTKNFAAYSANQFVQDILVNGLGAKYLCVGDDFRFGKNRSGDFSFLQKAGSEHGFDVTAHDTFTIDEQRVSSGRVRDALSSGNFTLAESLLGRSYSIQGVVEQGQQLGRTIGFPTANIVLPDALLAVSGVYAVCAQLYKSDGVTALNGLKEFNGVANVGTRPTVDGQQKRLEVHLFDFGDDIYGQKMRVTFKKKIRDEKKFVSFDELTQQIEKDARQVRLYFQN